MATTNNTLNNASKRGVASTIQTFVVSNSDNTSTSAAQVQISVGGNTTTGDPQETYIITSATTWSMGADNSLSGQFTICSNAALGTSNAQTISTAGIVNWPLQPAVLGILTSTQNSKTGNGSTPFSVTPYTLIFDKGTNQGAVNFTAPAAGKYMFQGTVSFTNCLASNGIQIQLVSTNKTFVKTVNRTASAADNSANMNAVGTMAAGDTAHLVVSGFGEASARNNVVGGTATAVTYWVVYKLS